MNLVHVHVHVYMFCDMGCIIIIYFLFHTQFAQRVCEQEGYKVYSPDLVCEGGGIAFDGEGTVITTESVLMDGMRNPGKTKEDIETLLLNNLGAQKVIWLPQGIYKDLVTKGHVDNLVAFVKPAEVVLTWTDDEGDPQYEISRRAEEILRGVVDAQGRTLTIHRYNCK